MKDFYTEIYVNALPNKVWDAFLSKDRFFKAFYNSEIKSTFKIGDRIEYSGEYNGQETIHIYGKILDFEKEKLLSYTDHPGPMYHSNHADLESRVTITFDLIGKSTKLCLTNDNFSANNPLEEKTNQWYLILSNFKTFVETGKLMSLS